MIRATMVAAMLLVGSQARAASCVDTGGGWVQCADGSYGKLEGDTLYLTRPDPGGPTTLIPQNCYRGLDGELTCG